MCVSGHVVCNIPLILKATEAVNQLGAGVKVGRYGGFESALEGTPPAFPKMYRHPILGFFKMWEKMK